MCQQPATRIHTPYARYPTDLPWGGHAVRFELHVRTFFCLTTTCPRRIVTERLPEVGAPSARTTGRLTALPRAIAFALGGEAGARLAHQIGIAASPTLRISLIRRAPAPLPPSPRMLGVDDWAQREGIRYGTAIVDLDSPTRKRAGVGRSGGSRSTCGKARWPRAPDVHRHDRTGRRKGR